jgi:hypothetical protein
MIDRNPGSVLPDSGFAFQINPKSPTREAVASFVQKRLDAQNDPARIALPPLMGEDAIPHAVTFASLIGSYSNVYLLPDESTQGMAQDAQLMRLDLGIMECLEIRQRLVAELDWTIEPPDEKNAGQKALAAELTQILKNIRRVTEYRRSMQEAIWVGRSAIQHRYGWEMCGDRQYLMPKPLHKDHPGWMPIHGDKLLFRYDDGRKMKDGEYAHQLGIRVSTSHIPDGRATERDRAIPTAHGMAIFLKPFERDTILVHKHMIEDSDFNDIRTAGRVHGVGIRSRIHKEWILKQEVLAFMMQYLERSAGGIEIWEYPSGDTGAKNACMQAAKERSANGRNTLFFPKPLGEDAALFDLKIVEPGFAGIDIVNQLQDKFFGHRIKRYMIGQTLTTEADATGLGSGVADAHKDTLSQIILYDGSNHEETVSEELVRPIQLFNFPETSRWKFKFKLQFQADDSKEKLDGMRNAWEMGARIAEKDVLDAISVSIPTEDDRILVNPAMQAGAGGMAGMAGGPGGPSPFGTLPAGTKVVSAAVHQAMGAAGVETKQDGDGDGFSGDGTDGQRPVPAPIPAKPEQYQRRSHRLLSEAASQTHTEPTSGQIKAGNFSKGVFPWKGLQISIENPKGSTRRGISDSGRHWERKMTCHYGYFRRTEGADGDQLDVYLGNHPDSDFLLVIKQVDADGDFDEFKVVAGCLNRKEAKKLYLSNYPKGWKCGPAASMTVGMFKKWVDAGGPMKARYIAKIAE